MVHGLETLERLNAAPATSQKIKCVVVVCCGDTEEIAIYVDGHRADVANAIWLVDVSEAIVEAVGGSDVPFTLKTLRFDCVAEKWPRLLQHLEEEAIDI